MKILNVPGLTRRDLLKLGIATTGLAVCPRLLRPAIAEDLPPSPATGPVLRLQFNSAVQSVLPEEVP